MGQFEEFLCLLVIELLLESVQHAVECHFGCVGDEAEHRVGDITVNSLTDAFCQLLTQRLALLIYIAVTSSAEVCFEINISFWA